MTVVDSLNQAGPAAPGQVTPAPAAADGQADRPPGLARDPEARLAALFDPGTLVLLTPHDDSGALAATGKIGGMAAVAFASDPRVQGGAMGSAACAAIVTAHDEALAQGAPLIGLWHSGGARLREGVELSDGPTKPARVERLRDSEKYSFLEMTITEGRNRQVRRMLEAVDSKVLKLVRTAIGGVRIGDLPIGKWQPLTADEVKKLSGSRPRWSECQRRPTKAPAMVPRKK